MTDIITSENMLVGAALLNTHTAREVLQAVSPEDLAVEANRELLKAMLKIDARGEIIDAAKAANESGVDRRYCMELMDVAPLNLDVTAHAEAVIKAAMRRDIRAALDRGNIALDAETPPEEVIDELSKSLDETTKRASGSLITGEDAALEFWKRLDGGTFAVKTGFEDIDYVLGGGMLNSGLYVLAARPGCGKTALALQIADNVAQREGAVLFVSLEMDTVQLTARRVSRICRIPASKMLLGGATDEEKAAAARAGKQIVNVPLYLNKTLRCGVGEIRTMARKVRDLKLVVIDYLQLIKPNMRLKSRYEQVTEISGQLKILARTLGVPVLCLAQINRASEQRGDKKPMLADLRDSGAIEQDADSVMFLYRPDMYDDEDKTENVQVKVIVAKNRHAATGEIDMMLNLESGAFRAAEWHEHGV